MGAKDTVIKDKELALIKMEHVTEMGETRPDIREYVDAALERQAEISFKAGRKEVVEFIREHSLNPLPSFIDPSVRNFQTNLTAEVWQAKLKEWGIE